MDTFNVKKMNLTINLKNDLYQLVNLIYMQI